jgi:hypothetical protein
LAPDYGDLARIAMDDSGLLKRKKGLL